MSQVTIFDKEFEQICQDLTEMGHLIDKSIAQCVKALSEGDAKLAHKVMERDQRVNELRFKIEEACLALIATQQPTASDLRAVVAAMHVVVELERIGDYAAGIGKTVVLMKEEPMLKTLKKLPRMGELSRELLAEGMKAFFARDGQLARQVAGRDQEMDDMYRSVFDRLVEIMAKDPELVTRCTYLMWCAHNFERMADRVTNIAERVIFMTTGALQEL